MGGLKSRVKGAFVFRKLCSNVVSALIWHACVSQAKTGEWTLSARETFATFNIPDASLLSVFSAVQERRQSLLAADAPPLKSASQHQRHVM